MGHDPRVAPAKGDPRKGGEMTMARKDVAVLLVLVVLLPALA